MTFLQIIQTSLSISHVEAVDYFIETNLYSVCFTIQLHKVDTKPESTTTKFSLLNWIDIITLSRQKRNILAIIIPNSCPSHKKILNGNFTLLSQKIYQDMITKDPSFSNKDQIDCYLISIGNNMMICLFLMKNSYLGDPYIVKHRSLNNLFELVYPFPAGKIKYEHTYRLGLDSNKSYIINSVKTFILGFDANKTYSHNIYKKEFDVCIPYMNSRNQLVDCTNHYQTYILKNNLKYNYVQYGEGMFGFHNKSNLSWGYVDDDNIKEPLEKINNKTVSSDDYYQVIIINNYLIYQIGKNIILTNYQKNGWKLGFISKHHQSPYKCLPRKICWKDIPQGDNSIPQGDNSIPQGDNALVLEVSNSKTGIIIKYEVQSIQIPIKDELIIHKLQSLNNEFLNSLGLRIRSNIITKILLLIAISISI